MVTQMNALSNYFDDPLDMMPIFCGDHTLEPNSTEMRNVSPLNIDLMVATSGAPLISTSLLH